MKIDVLAFGAHPDDVELSCSGTLLKLKAQGKKIGIIDLTKGEMGTRGTDLTRKQEAADASSILELDVRENLDLGDGSFEINQENRLAVIRAIRKYQPTIVLEPFCTRDRFCLPDTYSFDLRLYQALSCLTFRVTTYLRNYFRTCFPHPNVKR